MLTDVFVAPPSPPPPPDMRSVFPAKLAGRPPLTYLNQQLKRHSNCYYDFAWFCAANICVYFSIYLCIVYAPIFLAQLF
jgi:hypothetical protein